MQNSCLSSKLYIFLLFRRAEVGPNITEVQKEAICKLPPKMTKRCKALIRGSSFAFLLLKLLCLWFWLLRSVTEFALAEESFEANVRDYTKIVHGYGKENRLEDGFVYDQVILTKFVHIYSKAGNLKMAEETFEELKLLGQPLDKRSYGSMITLQEKYSIATTYSAVTEKLSL
ncbi:hypothetical protein UlMin_016373 [Ulmus minor]